MMGWGQNRWTVCSTCQRVLRAFSTGQVNPHRSPVDGEWCPQRSASGPPSASFDWTTLRDQRNRLQRLTRQRKKT